LLPYPRFNLENPAELLTAKFPTTRRFSLVNSALSWRYEPTASIDLAFVRGPGTTGLEPHRSQGIEPPDFDLRQPSRSRYIRRRMTLGEGGAKGVSPEGLKISRCVFNPLDASGHFAPLLGDLEKALPHVQVVHGVCPKFDGVGVTTILTYFLIQGHSDTPLRI
jgi:hypothetical protein